MTNTTYIKKFIREFNFPNPDWSNLPPNFPNLPKTELTREERYLLDGIVLAWTATRTDGKRMLYRNFFKAGISFAFLFIGLISFISLINQPGEDNFTRTVNAATVKIDEAIQSTMSAIMRR